VTVLPLHHPTPHCRGTITAGLWGGGCRDPHLGVHHLFILVLHCVLVVVAGAGVVALLEVPGVQEHLHPLLPGQDHALTHQDAFIRSSGTRGRGPSATPTTTTSSSPPNKTQEEHFLGKTCRNTSNYASENQLTIGKLVTNFC